MLEGLATGAGTQDYAVRHPAAPGHYRVAQGLTVSSLGMGSYLGGKSARDRARYTEAALACLRSGVNVLDTAANYRDQASERDLGRALRAYADGGGSRSHVVVCTKAGFLHGDADEGDQEAWFGAEYLGEGGTAAILRPGEVRSGHTLAPAYIRHELGRSRRNLGVEGVDVHFLHNPEHQLEWGVEPAAFYAAVEDAFEELEHACDAGHLAMYGVATWDGLRAPPGTRGHLELVRLVHHAGQARMRAGGRAGGHHLRAVQLPVNAAMPEAATAGSQPWRTGHTTALAAAQELGMLVLAAASLAQMRMAAAPPPALGPGLRSGLGLAHAALQHTRTTPGVTTALVGMGDPAHAAQNADFARRTPAVAGAPAHPGPPPS